MNMMQYKGYTAKIEYSDVDKCLVGRVLGIRDIIGFDASNVKELEKEFHATLDFYLQSCKESGKTPDRPYSGKLNLRLPQSLHRKLSHVAEATGRSMNEIIIEALQQLPANGDLREFGGHSLDY